jgi:hypothetical protein
MEPSGGDKGKEKAYANADRGRGCHDLDHDEIHPPFETWNCPVRPDLSSPLGWC